MGGKGSGRKPRDYPPDIVQMICEMYRSGMTVAEIRKEAPKGYRVQTILERYLPERRSAAKRDQRGPSNHMWSNHPGYQARHLRLGQASAYSCIDCGNPAEEWSYIGGCAQEMRDGAHPSPYCLHDHHYSPRCRRCHRRHDRKEVMPYA